MPCFSQFSMLVEKYPQARPAIISAFLSCSRARGIFVR